MSVTKSFNKHNNTYYAYDTRYMLYGDIPSLEHIMERIFELEREINTLK